MATEFENESNPYAAPMVADTMAAPDGSAESIRQANATHEANIRAVGLLYWIPTLPLSAWGLEMVATFRDGSLVVVGIVLLALAVGFAVTGYRIRQLRPRTKYVVGVISGIGLCAIPIGTVVNGFVLWVFFCEKGRFILSDEYRSVLDATPHVKPVNSLVMKLVLVAAVVFLLGLAWLVWERH